MSRTKATATPTCPGCGKKLFKTISKDHRAASDPIYCRTVLCEFAPSLKHRESLLIKRKPRKHSSEDVVIAELANQITVAEDERAMKLVLEEANKLEAEAALQEINHALEEKPVPPPQPVPELPAVAKTRDRIRALLTKAQIDKSSKVTIGIALALLSQETGNHAAANALIVEHKLDVLLGLKIHTEKHTNEIPKSDVTDSGAD